MKRIQVLGTGCMKCNTLLAQVRIAAEAMELEYELEKVTEITEIAKHGVMMTPALVVDGKVKIAGRVPDLDMIKRLLTLDD